MTFDRPYLPNEYENDKAIISTPVFHRCEIRNIQKCFTRFLLICLVWAPAHATFLHACVAIAYRVADVHTHVRRMLSIQRVPALRFDKLLSHSRWSTARTTQPATNLFCTMGCGISRERVLPNTRCCCAFIPFAGRAEDQRLRREDRRARRARARSVE